MQKFLQSPIVITLASFVSLAWAIADYYDGSQNFENRFSILVLVPLVVYLLWLGWVLFLLKSKSQYGGKKFERRFYTVFMVVCVSLLIFQFQVASPVKEVLRYAMFCLIAGLIFAAGLIKRFENINT